MLFHKYLSRDISNVLPENVLLAKRESLKSAKVNYLTIIPITHLITVF